MRHHKAWSRQSRGDGDAHQDPDLKLMTGGQNKSYFLLGALVAVVGS